MPRPFHTLALLCALLPLAAASHAKGDGHDKDRAAIAADYRAYDTAAQNKDANGCVQFCTDDYTVADAKGTILIHNKSEAVTSWKQIFAHADTITSKTAVQSVRFTKQGASVTIKNTSTLVITAHGAAHTYADTATFQNDWVRSGGTWQMKRSVALTDVSTRDGQPVP